MFYLTTHSVHIVYELYGIRRMVKDHSNNKLGNPPQRPLYSFRLAASDFLCMYH